jgi:hypothetical protein
MSRSFHKSPYSYYCAGNSGDRVSKILWHQRMRAAIRQCLHNLDPDTVCLPDRREVSNLWAMKADCKYRFDPRENPELLRK